MAADQKPAADMKTQLLQRIQDRTAVVGIIGLGYVGLPLAVEFAKAGFHVIGYDVSERVCTLRVGGLRADDDTELDLPVRLLRTFGQNDGVVRTTERGDRLLKDDGLRR